MKKRKLLKTIEDNCFYGFQLPSFSTFFYPKNNPTNTLNLNNTLTTII